MWLISWSVVAVLFETDTTEGTDVSIFPTKSLSEEKVEYINMRLEYLTEKPALIFICGLFNY
jgi:hypothetical protein